MEHFIITIARGFGSGGKEMGVALAKELGIPCYDEQLYTLLEQYSGINKALFINAEQKVTFLKRLKALPQDEYIVSPMTKAFVSNENLYKIQVKLIREMAQVTSCVIIGKCANHILKNQRRVVSVFVDAPEEKAIRRVMEKMKTTEEEAKRLITKTNKYRSDYYTYYTGGEKWRNTLGYDLTLNTGRLTKEESMASIRAVLKAKQIID